MAGLKWILGTETEYGIISRQPETSDPVSNSILLINSYPFLPAPQALWDYEYENPLLDLRGFEVEGERERPDPAYNRMINKLLANGGRLYVDGAHPEYSTPECHSPAQVVAYEKAGERILDTARELANRTAGTERFLVYKNNTDGKGNSYGYHENYLVSRSIPFEALLHHLTPFFVTRQIYAGAGKVGTENRRDYVPYQLSQRADFFETLVDLNTMVRRPIINTRDEPHADSAKYRRLHVIVGDANMSEPTTYLKVGVTMIVLSLLEDGYVVKDLELEDAVCAMQETSRDPTLTTTLRLANRTPMSAIEIQRAYLNQAYQWATVHPPDPVVKDILAKWERVLDRLAKDPMDLAREIDWVIKRELLLSFMEKKRCDWNDPRVAMLDLQYHDLRRDKGLYATLERGGYVERLVTEEDIQAALRQPPAETRAYMRAMCLRKFPKEVYAASWSSLVFDTGRESLQRIRIMEPGRGTQALTQSLFETSASSAEFLEKLTV